MVKKATKRSLAVGVLTSNAASGRVAKFVREYGASARKVRVELLGLPEAAFDKIPGEEELVKKGKNYTYRMKVVKLDSINLIATTQPKINEKENGKKSTS